MRGRAWPTPPPTRDAGANPMFARQIRDVKERGQWTLCLTVGNAQIETCPALLRCDRYRTNSWTGSAAPTLARLEPATSVQKIKIIIIIIKNDTRDLALEHLPILRIRSWYRGRPSHN